MHPAFLPCKMPDGDGLRSEQAGRLCVYLKAGLTMTKTKTQRYDTTVLDARALADALEIEEKAGWEVAEAGYDGTDFVVTFEREDAR